MKRPQTEILIHNAMMPNINSVNFSDSGSTVKKADLDKIERLILGGHVLKAVDKLTPLRHAVVTYICSPDEELHAQEVVRVMLAAVIKERFERFIKTDIDKRRCKKLIYFCMKNFYGEVWHRTHRIKDAEICRQLGLKQANFKKKKKNWYRVYIELLSFIRNLYLDGIDLVDNEIDPMFEDA